MKAKHVWSVICALVLAAVYIEKFYEHPTLGNGLRAFLAAASLGKLV
jgi:hypothetical protein